MSVKTAGVGHFAIPTAPAAGTSCTSGSANVFTTTYVQLIASTAAAIYLTGIHVESAAALTASYIIVQLASGGAGSETIIGQYLVPLATGSTAALGYRPIFPPIPVATSTRIACKTADSVGSKATLITLECINQSNVVDDGIAITTVSTVTNQLTAAAIAAGVWRDAVAADFTQAGSVGLSVMNGVALGTGLTIATVTNQLTAAAIAAGVWRDTVAGDFTVALSVGKSVMNGVILGTGLTVNDLTTKTGYGLAAGQKVDVDTIKTNPVVNAGTVTFPTGATLASTTNITAAAGCALAASQHVIVDSGTVTTLSNLPAVTTDWLTAAGIKADAVTKIQTGLATPTNITAASGVALAASQHVIVDSGTITTYTGNTPQTGDAFARVGAPVGASLSVDVAAVKTDTGAIKTQTDKLAFTVANKVNANIHAVNDVTVNGDGSGTPWGP